MGIEGTTQGLIRHKKGYWEYVSVNGLTYELLEGKTIGGDKEWTSDILFILLDTSGIDCTTNFDKKRTVGWFYGATNLNETGYLFGETVKYIQQYVDEYEKRYPDVVEEYKYYLMGKLREKKMRLEEIINIAKNYQVDQSDDLESFLCELLGVNCIELYKILESEV